jgi:hypothetical protein
MVHGLPDGGTHAFHDVDALALIAPTPRQPVPDVHADIQVVGQNCPADGYPATAKRSVTSFGSQRSRAPVGVVKELKRQRGPATRQGAQLG